MIFNENESTYSTLTEREIYVLQARYGLLEDNKCQTLDEIAKKLKVTRERIRQLEAKAREKVRITTSQFFYEKLLIKEVIKNYKS